MLLTRVLSVAVAQVVQVEPWGSQSAESEQVRHQRWQQAMVPGSGPQALEPWQALTGLRLMAGHHHHHRSWRSHQLRGWSEDDRARKVRHQLGSDDLIGLCRQVAAEWHGHHLDRCVSGTHWKALQVVVGALQCSLVARQVISRNVQKVTVELTRGLDQLQRPCTGTRLLALRQLQERTAALN